VAEFNRYNQHKLVLADERLRGMRFDGAFRIDGYEALVRLLETHFNISAERGGGQTMLRLAP
jgi:ferric-dicitrate binding protein FerR (iron transport regulator)